MIDRKKFSERLKNLRNQKNVTGVSVARTLGITPQSFHAWEIGKTVPTSDLLVALADLFDVSIDYLVGRSDKPKGGN